MKKGIHPAYNYVVYRDTGAGFSFLTRSTATSEKTVTWEDGQEYSVIDVEISSASHPFYTGTQKMVDTTGRIEKFQKKYQKSSLKKSSPIVS